MPDQPQNKRSHFILLDTSQILEFTPRGGGAPSPVPALPRKQQGAFLQQQIDNLKLLAAKVVQAHSDFKLESKPGLQVQFSSQPDVEFAFESLANDRKKIELLSVHNDDNQILANVFIPDGKLKHFEQYISDYLDEKKDCNGRARDHQKLIDAIKTVFGVADFRTLWTDDKALLPDDLSVAFWWEVWLPTLEKRQAVVEDFKKLARLAGCFVNDKQVNFPERTVLIMYGSQQMLSQSVMTLNYIAELRYAKETAEFFDGMHINEQQEWIDDLLQRVRFYPLDDNVPRVCLLDSGVNRAHPLLEPLIDRRDLHTVEPAWGVNDEAGHGTSLAGLVGYGDLTSILASTDMINVSHRLESVKLIPTQGANEGDARHHAYLFTESVARPEISAPNRLRVFSSAVTASDYRDRGRPSSWSAAVDSLAADTNGAGENPRLFVLSAGNTVDSNAWNMYPDSLSTNFVHDPGQAWNAITVGACTVKTETEDHPFLNPVAEAGGLSPFTTSTAAWDKAWPLKPDVVLEGGNAAKDDFGAVSMSSLSLLTTHHQLQERLFTTSNATSAASALCAGMAARIMAAYPQLRPETVRALIVHSAQWTECMQKVYLPTKPNKDDYTHLIRHCGWGMPDLDRALWSAGNSLTLVIEDVLYPYDKTGSVIKTRNMNLHSLPWPIDELEALQDTPVEMRVTLSYFIEPNPSTRGVESKYHYPSHRLRFDVKRPLEASTESFIARVNTAAKHEHDGDHANIPDSNWLLGERQRFKGSLHQDVWRGTAAELASRGAIVVYPASGWWRTRPALKRYDSPARYSLVVSISTPKTDVDLYAAIAQKILTANAVIVET